MSTSQQVFRQFSLDEIKEATNNFDDDLIIGKGGFGLVYIGLINGGAKAAIKRLSSESAQGETEFSREIQTLSKLQHHNLVRLHGYCNESREKILVYEYMPNGTLVDHLYKNNQSSRLTWEQRLNICIGAAQGLDFLHRGATPGVIHRDIKGSNILLDDNFMAKIADFGLAKLVKMTNDPQSTSVSTTIFKGTFGYMDPEYFYTQRLTTKTDVYAFGVVLLVVLSGRPAVDNKAVEDQRSLTEWANKCIAKNRVDLIIDPYLVGKVSPRSLKKFVKLSQKCLCRQSEQRPTMEEVAAYLQLALRRPTMEEVAAYLQLALRKQQRDSSSRKHNQSSTLTQMVLAKLQITMKKKQPGEEKWVLPASLAGCLFPRFSLEEIKTATQSFSNCIGHGGFGRVYLGRIYHGAELIAIRTYHKESEFLREIETLGKVQHENVIRLKGYCYESSEMIVIYEYMSQGSLESLIRGNKDQHCLSWEQRLKICIGVARGLDFLHRVIEPGVIHRDVRCSNIMLDDNFVPKVTGFGLAKLADSEDDTITDAGIYGTLGYIDPEYVMTGRVTKKMDVYSFGVVLLAVLSGRVKVYDIISRYDEVNSIHISKWAEKCIQDNTIDELIDPGLRGQFKSVSLVKFLDVAQNCLHVQPERRHTMEDVVAGLELALEKQLDPTTSQWVESRKLPDLVCLLQPESNMIQQDEEYPESSDEGEYSGEYLSELYGEFLEEHSEM